LGRARLKGAESDEEESDEEEEHEEFYEQIVRIEMRIYILELFLQYLFKFNCEGSCKLIDTLSNPFLESTSPELQV
jgi:hypothetical protein